MPDKFSININTNEEGKISSVVINDSAARVEYVADTKGTFTAKYFLNEAEDGSEPDITLEQLLEKINPKLQNSYKKYINEKPVSHSDFKELVAGLQVKYLELSPVEDLNKTIAKNMDPKEFQVLKNLGKDFRKQIEEMIDNDNQVDSTEYAKLGEMLKLAKNPVVKSK